MEVCGSWSLLSLGYVLRCIPPRLSIMVILFRGGSWDLVLVQGGASMDEGRI